MEARSPKRMKASPAVERSYLTVSEAAAYTRLHPVTLWRARRDGMLRASGYKRAIRFRIDHLDEFMAARGNDQEQR